MWRNTPSNAFAPSDAPETRQTMVTQDYAYFGGLFRGFKSGFGTIIFNDNSVYSGTFHEDQFSGNGTFIYANGAVLSGAFSRGELVQGTVTFLGQTNEIKGGLWRHMFGQVVADAPRQPQVAPSQVPPPPRYGGAFEQEVLTTMKHLAHTTQAVQLDVTRMQGELQKQSQRQEATSQVVQELKKQMVSLEEWKRIPAKVQHGAPDIPAKPFVYQPPAMPAPPQVPAKAESKTSQKPAAPQINPQPQVIPPQANQPPQAAAIPAIPSKAPVPQETETKSAANQKSDSKKEFTAPDGTRYVGFWEGNDYQNGRGTITDAVGNVYEGAWINNLFEGEAVFKQANQVTFIGSYQNGKKHGQGTFKYPNGKEVRATYKNGKVVESETIYPNGNTYKNGKMTFSNGDSCEIDKCDTQLIEHVGITSSRIEQLTEEQKKLLKNIQYAVKGEEKIIFPQQNVVKSKEQRENQSQIQEVEKEENDEETRPKFITVNESMGQTKLLMDMSKFQNATEKILASLKLMLKENERVDLTDDLNILLIVNSQNLDEILLNSTKKIKKIIRKIKKIQEFKQEKQDNQDQQEKTTVFDYQQYFQQMVVYNNLDTVLCVNMKQGEQLIKLLKDLGLDQFDEIQANEEPWCVIPLSQNTSINQIEELVQKLNVKYIVATKKAVQEVVEQALPAKEETTPVYNKDLFNQPPVVGTTFGTVLPEVQQVKYDEVLIHLESFPLKTAQKLIPLITKQFPSINVDVQGVDIIMMVPSDQTEFVLQKMKKIVVNKQLLTISVNGLYVQQPDCPPGIAQPDVQEPAQKQEVQEFAYQPPVADHVPLGVYEEEPKLKQHKLADGTTYVGKWEGDDFRNGEGTIENKKGNVYEGKWVDDYFEGHGVYRYASGFVYVGTFHQGLKHGYGTYSSETQGSCEKGIFENGKLVRDYEVTYQSGNILRSDKIMSFKNGEQWQIDFDDVEDLLVKKLGKSKSLKKAKLSEEEMSRVKQIQLETPNQEKEVPKAVKPIEQIENKKEEEPPGLQQQAKEEPNHEPALEKVVLVQLQVNLEAFNQKEITKIIKKFQEYLGEQEKVDQEGQFAVITVKEANRESVAKSINKLKIKEQKLVCTLKPAQEPEAPKEVCEEPANEAVQEPAENAEEPPGLDQPQEPFVQAPQEVKEEEPPGLGETTEEPPGLEGDLVKLPEPIPENIAPVVEQPKVAEEKVKQDSKPEKKHVLEDGTTYLGQWKDDDFMTGTGTILAPNGNRYTGKWINDKFEGKAVYNFANGNVYEGKFKGGRKNGLGVMTLANGIQQKGHWAHKKLTKDIEIVHPNQNSMKIDGKLGTITYANRDSCQVDNVDYESPLVEKLLQMNGFQQNQLTKPEKKLVSNVQVNIQKLASHVQKQAEEAAANISTEPVNVVKEELVKEPVKQEKCGNEYQCIVPKDEDLHDCYNQRMNAEEPKEAEAPPGLDQPQEPVNPAPFVYAPEAAPQQEPVQEEAPPGLGEEPPGLEENLSTVFIQLQVNLEFCTQKEIAKIIKKFQEYLGEQEKVEQEGQFAVITVKEANRESVAKSINKLKIKEQKLVCTLKPAQEPEAPKEVCEEPANEAVQEPAENAEEPPGLDQPQEPFVQAPQEVKEEEPPGLGETTEEPPGLEGDLVKLPEPIPENIAPVVEQPKVAEEKVKQDSKPEKKHVLEDGTTYLGQWKDDDFMTGTGTILAPNGNRYTGKWINDKFEGKAVYNFANGNVYEGKFKGGRKNGLGVMTLANGIQQKGHWAHKKLTKDIEIVHPNQNSMKIDGKLGTITYANGDSCQVDNVDYESPLVEKLLQMNGFQQNQLTKPEKKLVSDVQVNIQKLASHVQKQAEEAAANTSTEPAKVVKEEPVKEPAKQEKCGNEYQCIVPKDEDLHDCYNQRMNAEEPKEAEAPPGLDQPQEPVNPAPFVYAPEAAPQQEPVQEEAPPGLGEEPPGLEENLIQEMVKIALENELQHVLFIRKLTAQLYELKEEEIDQILNEIGLEEYAEVDLEGKWFIVPLENQHRNEKISTVMKNNNLIFELMMIPNNNDYVEEQVLESGIEELFQQTVRENELEGALFVKQRDQNDQILTQELIKDLLEQLVEECAEAEINGDIWFVFPVGIESDLRSINEIMHSYPSIFYQIVISQ
ncbi:MORN_repeat protein [Hexamita inflata]|uniref:MORN repeat protein n=1 Tax=Hexamita inflata TaxID=28002 RepID=A0AA86RES1_9EUKA|nr:MORN repeat protein [Hexamita inflata]